MKIAKICPKCGTPGIEVNKNAVDFFFFLNQQQNDWSACVNKKCKVGYFSSDHVLNTHDLNSILWYKTDSKKAYTCYCSKLTRADIIQAVKQDAKTFTDVQKMTGKTKPDFIQKKIH